MADPPTAPARPRWLVGLLGAIWLWTVPKTPFDLLARWPATTLAVSAWASAPSPSGRTLVLLALCWDMVTDFWVMVSAMYPARRWLIRLIRRSGDCRFIPVDFEATLSPENRARIEQNSMHTRLAGYGLPFDALRSTRILRVEMGPSGRLPDGLGAYNLPFIESIILLRDEPEDASPAESFFFWHEIGHTLGDESSSQSWLHKDVKKPLSTVLLTAFFVPFETTPILLLVMSALGVLLVHRIMVRWRRIFRASVERRADAFAVAFLDADQRRHVAGYVEGLIHPDRGLTREEHLSRVANLRALLTEGKDVTGPDATHRWFGLLADLLLGSTLALGWMILLARHVTVPGPDGMRVLGWIVAAAAVLSVLHFLRHYLAGIFLEAIFMGYARFVGDRYVWTGRRGAEPAKAS